MILAGLLGLCVVVFAGYGHGGGGGGHGMNYKVRSIVRVRPEFTLS